MLHNGPFCNSVPSACFSVRKILNLRVFDNDSGKRWSKSVMDKDYEVLCVSQVCALGYDYNNNNNTDDNNINSTNIYISNKLVKSVCLVKLICLIISVCLVKSVRFG